MRKLQRWGLVALLVLLGFEILTIAPRKLGSPKDSEKVKEKAQGSPSSSVQTTSQVMQGVHLFGTNEGQKEWELDSDSAQGFKEKGTWKLKGVRVKFFGKAGNTYTVTGDTGSIQTEIKDMEILGNVVTKTSEGYTMKSNSLTYSGSKKTLNTADHVTMIGPPENGRFEMSGKGFFADLNTNVMNLKQNVQALKAIPPNRMMNIKSVWSRINGKNNEAHFEEQVQVDIDDVRMTGHQADFVYDQKAQQIKSLLMQGNVRVTDQRHWASAKKAKVLFVENQFILLGNPRVLQDGNEMRGEEIHFLDGGKQVRVFRARARVDNDDLENSVKRKSQ